MRIRLRKYQITMEDASRLSKVWSLRISRVRLVCTLILLVLMLMAIGAMVVYISPLRRSMPGYISGSEREKVLGSISRLDTLSLVVASNQAFLDNVMKLMDTERVSQDSLSASQLLAPLPLDSLKTASAVERAFVAEMAEREKYNLNVLSPVAAESMIFTDPVQGAIIASDSENARLLRLLVPKGQGVSAIADGQVISRIYDQVKGTHTLLIQSHRGFLSRYTGLGLPLVDEGDAVISGQCISMGTDNADERNYYVGIEMWREGTSLIPGQLLYRQRRSPKSEDDITAPRGK